MPYFLALDAGGTKTQCWIADEKQVLGRSTAGTVKLMNVGEELATQRLGELVRNAAKDAGVLLQGVEHACIGIAGFSIEAVRVWAHKTLEKFVRGSVSVCGDESIALDAAFQGGPGVMVIAGTGTNIVGRCADGTRLTAGGWGPVVGDEGSGSWIGLQGVKAGLWGYDRGKKTILLDRIRETWDLKSLGELIAKANQNRRPDFAELASAVVACADEGDELAADVLFRAGKELAEQVSLVIGKMVACGCDPEDGKRVGFTGSILGQVRDVRDSMHQHLLALRPGIQVAAEPVEPLEGALWRARHGVTA